VDPFYRAQIHAIVRLYLQLHTDSHRLTIDRLKVVDMSDNYHSKTWLNQISLAEERIFTLIHQRIYVLGRVHIKLGTSIGKGTYKTGNKYWEGYI